MSITMEYFQMLILKNNKILKKSDFLKEKMIFVVHINNRGKNNGNKNQTKKNYGF